MAEIYTGVMVDAPPQTEGTIMYVEYLLMGRMVRVPRKVKKLAKKNGVTVTAKTGRKTWLGVRADG